MKSRVLTCDRGERGRAQTDCDRSDLACPTEGARLGAVSVWCSRPGLLLQDAGVAAENAALRQQHEAGLAAFLLPERRARFRESLEAPRRRRKLYAELYHFDGRLDARFATLQEQHTKHEGHVEQVHALLANEGAPRTCFVLATIELDGQEAPLREALEELMWIGAGFISCIPGELGIYVSEDGSNVYVLRRKP
jgi:hypothetical protein